MIFVRRKSANRGVMRGEHCASEGGVATLRRARNVHTLGQRQQPAFVALFLREVVERRPPAGRDDGKTATEPGAHRFHAGLHRGKAVAVAGEVREEDVPPARARHTEEEFADRFVGQMAVASADPLFGGPGPPNIGLQEPWAVVGFNHDHVHVPQPLVDVQRRMPEVGQPRNRAARREKVVLLPGRKGEAHGFLGVVRDRKTVHLEVAKTETRTRFKDLPGRTVIQARLHRARGGGVREDLDGGMLLQRVNTRAVVAMLVRQEDGVDLLEACAGVVQELLQFPTGKTGIHEHAGASCLEEGGIARTTAAEDAEPDRHSAA